MKQVLASLLMLWSIMATATGLVDLKFGRAQIADSQWNVQACTQTATCQIFSTNPGTAYKIPWTSGQIQWAAGDYIQFIDNSQKDANNPWLAVHYGSNGAAKDNMGTGHIINMGTDFFFFVGNDNNTGQLFSMTSGLSGNAGVTWTGTLNPTPNQVNTYAANGSTAPLAAGQTAPPPGPPPLCCGGSSAQFNANSADVAMVQTFAVRSTNNSQVYVSQIGNDNNTTINQSGTKNNYAYYSGVGSNNAVTVTQSGDSTTQANYSRTTVTGDSNTVAVTQTSSGGAKGAFVGVTNNNNNLTLSQTGSGSHYAEVNLLGGNKTVDIAQSGSTGHMASVALSGLPSGLNLQQTGSTQQFYSIQFNCATAGGCAPISVKQGN
jgi:hypothetical protein